MLIIVNYHYVRPSFEAPYPSIYGVTPVALEEQLGLLGSLGQFVSGAEMVAAADGRTTLAERAFLVTFDDGLQEQFELAWPLLRRLGIPALFFPNTVTLESRRLLTAHKIHLLRAYVEPDRLRRLLGQSLANVPARLPLSTLRARAIAHYRYDPPEVAELKFLLNFGLDFRARDEVVTRVFAESFPRTEAEMARELYMTADQVRQLAAAGCLGSHAHDHLPLGLLDDAELRLQLQRSVEILVHLTGRAPLFLSYPYGTKESCGPRVATCASELGFRFGLTTEHAANHDLEQPLLLARLRHNDVPGGPASLWSAENLFRKVPARTWWRT